MNTERPCICGCSFDDHAKLSFKGSKEDVYYCREHVHKPGFWCTTYTPVDNLKWLEIKSQNEKGQQAL
jgi:hypothetical protein